MWEYFAEHFHYDEFLGVQYADFVGRFKRANYPPKKIDGVIDATRLGNRCYQEAFTYVPIKQNGAEDCLNLNIFVPWGVQHFRLDV